MILLVDMAWKKDSLSQYEFVCPIADTFKRLGRSTEVIHFPDLRKIPGDCEGIVLCGTALKDNEYASRPERFFWIRDYDRPVLGICAGMQIISAVFGGEIVAQPAIGLEPIQISCSSELLGEPREIEGYHLHGFGATLPEGFILLAGGLGSVEAFRHKERPIFGIIFHPEVRNRWILERFARLLPGARHKYQRRQDETGI